MKQNNHIAKYNNKFKIILRPCSLTIVAKVPKKFHPEKERIPLSVFVFFILRNFITGKYNLQYPQYKSKLKNDPNNKNAPYKNNLSAYERMGYFAFVSIFDAIYKLW